MFRSPRRVRGGGRVSALCGEPLGRVPGGRDEEVLPQRGHGNGKAAPPPVPGLAWAAEEHGENGAPRPAERGDLALGFASRGALQCGGLWPPASRSRSPPGTSRPGSRPSPAPVSPIGSCSEPGPPLAAPVSLSVKHGRLDRASGSERAPSGSRGLQRDRQGTRTVPEEGARGVAVLTDRLQGALQVPPVSR